MYFPILLATLVAQASPVSPDAVKLAASLRAMLIQHLPEPLYVKSEDWGKMKPAFSRVHWKGQGLRVRPEVIRSEKEDGEWKKLQVWALNPSEKLQLGISKVDQQQDGPTTFDIGLEVPIRFLFERQIWKAGVKLYSGSAKGRLRIRMNLHCELTSKLETRKTLPELVLRVQVTAAHVGYDEFVLEHIGGFGGEAAELVGEMVRKVIHQWKPSIERELLAKANAAIIKAADTKEIRIGLDGIKRKKKSQS